MSNEQPNLTTDNAKQSLNTAVTSALALKTSNPKVFWGGIGAVVVLLLLIVSSGGDESTPIVNPGGVSAKDLAIGQQYVLKSPNSYDEKATIQLVPVPGTLAAYDESEEGETTPCKKIPQGTHVTTISFQDAYGKRNNFAQVKVAEGACKDKEGWVLSMDLQ